MFKKITVINVWAAGFIIIAGLISIQVFLGSLYPENPFGPWLWLFINTAPLFIALLIIQQKVSPESIRKATGLQRRLIVLYFGLQLFTIFSQARSVASSGTSRIETLHSSYYILIPVQILLITFALIKSRSFFTNQKESSVARKKVHFLAALPPTMSHLNLEKEFLLIATALSSSEDFHLIPFWKATPSDLIRGSIKDQDIYILHFSGHGKPTNDAHLASVFDASDLGGGLAFHHNENGTVQLIESYQLDSFFQSLKKKPEVVVLNACYSEHQATAIAKHIPYVIGTDNEVLDSSARNFSQIFYEALANGNTIVEAFNLGKSAVMLNSHQNKANFVLYKNGSVIS